MKSNGKTKLNSRKNNGIKTHEMLQLLLLHPWERIVLGNCAGIIYLQSFYSSALDHLHDREIFLSLRSTFFLLPSLRGAQRRGNPELYLFFLNFKNRK